jgi:hypothetical protein
MVGLGDRNCWLHGSLLGSQRSWRQGLRRDLWCPRFRRKERVHYAPGGQMLPGVHTHRQLHWIFPKFLMLLRRKEAEPMPVRWFLLTMVFSSALAMGAHFRLVPEIVFYIPILLALAPYELVRHAAHMGSEHVRFVRADLYQAFAIVLGFASLYPLWKASQTGTTHAVAVGWLVLCWLCWIGVVWLIRHGPVDGRDQVPNRLDTEKF